MEKILSLKPLLHNTEKGRLCSIVLPIDTVEQKDPNSLTFCERSALSEILNRTLSNEYLESMYFHNAGCVSFMVKKSILSEQQGLLEIFKTE